MNIAIKCAVAFALAVPLSASGQNRAAVAVAAGPSIPVGTFRDTQNQGVNISAQLIRGSDDSPLGIRLDGSYDRFPGKTVNAVKNAEQRIVAVSGGLILTASGYTLKPYLTAGGGAYKITSRPAAPNVKTRFGYDFGVGMTMPLANRAFFIEGRLKSVSQRNAKPLRYIPVVLGILF